MFSERERARTMEDQLECDRKGEPNPELYKDDDSFLKSIFGDAKLPEG
jgi:hypothetical protein